MDEQQPVTVRRRRWPRRLRRALLVALLLLLVALVVLWTMRIRLATDYIDRELARRGVQASYDVKRIGFGTQAFENLVIGDPARPDLTARRVEVQILIGWTGPRIGLITARGVRLRGRIVDGRLSLGEVDKLLPPPSGLPFRLPDQRIDVADSAILLDTPAGRLALGLAGRGNLADGFRGQLALVSRELRQGECRIEAPRGNLAVRVDDLRPSFSGPFEMQRLACGDDLAVERPRLALDIALAPAIDSWRGNARATAERLEAGPHRMAGLAGRLSFAGDAERTAGALALTSAASAVDLFRAGGTRFAGRYSLSPRHGDLGLVGEVDVRGLTVEPGTLAGLAGALRSAAGTPLGPVGESLAAALVRAGSGGAEASATLRLVNARGVGGVRLEQLRAASRSGASLRAVGGDGITYSWPSGTLRLDGDFALQGGGLPAARLQLSQARPGGPLSGVARIAPIAAGGSRLALGPVNFTGTPDGGTSFRTTASIDGGFDGGRIEGLVLPIAGRFGGGGFVLGPGCTDARFRLLQAEGLRIGPTRLPVCAVGRGLVWKTPGGPLRGGGEVRSARFAGRLGGSPIAILADRLRFDLARPGFDASGLDVALGGEGSVNRLEVASLEGRFARRGVTGEFAGLEGFLANVPLRVDQGNGRWRVERGDLFVDGSIRISDRRDPVRFHPLVSRDFSLTLDEGRISAGGWLEHPATGTRVARATVEHHLRSGAGHALLDVPGLRFSGSFQPDALTPLTVGIVALVEGSIAGRGRIEWDERGTRSTGTFSTAGMNLAAPFGPVEGLTTTIRFTDLLGLVSAPGQAAEADVVRAGIDVFDGTVRYQLLPDYRVAIEAGRWPFAGGELFLEPTVLDFSRPTTKYLTFRVVGMDAARFIQQMEFPNIAATGTFDGVIPMRFGRLDEGGRILGGEIVDGRIGARPPGGTLSYVGELTDRDLGPYGILAFNALKALQYNRFDVTLNGALDGEFITVIDLDGVARDPSRTTLPSGAGIRELLAGRVIGQLSRVPFEFNIRIQGRFRALIATARSFSDPSLLLSTELPRLLRAREAATTDVQREESENEP